MWSGAMTFDWLAWSNPVAVWWSFLLGVSIVNIGLFVALHRHLRRRALERDMFRLELLVLLCAAYVFGCAFRSILPRADVQRICLFDTWLSSVAVGRSVATIAEICFIVQWAIVLRELARFTQSDFARSVSNTIVPLIVLAECCSWYAVITTSYLGNAVENSLWAVAFLLIAAALLRLLVEFGGVVRGAMSAAFVGICGYLVFLVSIDVPMYLSRWQSDLASGKPILGLFAGLYDVSTRWAVTHDIAHWHEEMAWMALYFSAAVWSSLALCGFLFIQDRLHRYHARAPRLRAPALLTHRP
jgi:hypothetical protein